MTHEPPIFFPLTTWSARVTPFHICLLSLPLFLMYEHRYLQTKQNYKYTFVSFIIQYICIEHYIALLIVGVSINTNRTNTFAAVTSQIGRQTGCKIMMNKLDDKCCVMKTETKGRAKIEELSNRTIWELILMLHIRKKLKTLNPVISPVPGTVSIN